MHNQPTKFKDFLVFPSFSKLKPSTFSPRDRPELLPRFFRMKAKIYLSRTRCGHGSIGELGPQLNGSPPEKVTESQKGKFFFFKAHFFRGLFLWNFRGVIHYQGLIFWGGKVTLQVISFLCMISQWGGWNLADGQRRAPWKLMLWKMTFPLNCGGFLVTMLVFVGVAGGLRLMITTSHDVICWVLLGRWTCTRWRRTAWCLEDQHHSNGYYIEI